MRNKLLLGFGAAALVVLAGTGLHAQTYSNAVMALNPAGYWPLNEAAQPPFGAYIATNLGTAGANANGYYETWFQPLATTTNTIYYQTNNILHVAGAIADGDTAMSCTHSGAGNGQYVVFPRFTNGVANPAITLVPPFSIEVWVQPTTNLSTVMAIVNEGRVPNIDSRTGYATNNENGLSLGVFGTIFYFATWNNRGADSTKQEIDTALTANQWQHMVITFDGINQTWFKNGVQVGTRAIPASAINAAGERYTPDLTSPLLIGTGSIIGAGNGASEFGGNIDEVAIYTNVLSASSISAHFTAATATDSTYKNTVLADSPIIYVRLGEPAMSSASYPATATYPVATNYGLAGGSANGFFQPGTAPGVSGPPYAGFGASSRAVSINGFSGAVDISGGALPAQQNPTNTQPVSVAAWFQGDPSDAAARFQEIVGHGNSSWRIAMDNNAGLRFNPGNNPELQFANIADILTNNFVVNDGKWHFVAGVSDGTSDFLYVDGLLAKSNSPVGSITGSTLDAFIGGDPGFQVPIWNGNGTTQPRYFEGQIAHVAFFTNALSGAQIQSLYNVAGVPPSIVIQPIAALTNNVGANVSVPVGARGSATLSYQWYRTNGTAVAGQTTSTLTFNPVTTNNAGSYNLVVTNSFGAATSSVVTITVIGPPVVQQQSPTDVRVFVGTSPILHVTATGPQLNYQWKQNGTAIGGATNSSYTVTNTASVGSTAYSCSITNFAGSNGIAPITVNVVAAPTAPYPAAVLASHPIAYFRLDEADTGYPNNGVTAYDYAGGNNAAYNQATLQQPGYTSLTDTDTSALFADQSSVDSYAGNAPSYLSMTASNTSVQFSVEAWINPNFTPNTDAGIVTIGYGFGGEELNIDCGANTSTRPLRFYVNSATGVNYKINTSFIPYDSRWHHIVAVCDQAGGSLYFYADGALVGTAAIPANAGIRTLTAPLSIGSRLSSSAATSYDNQFYGRVDEVAIYNTALSQAQVQAHYLASGITPHISAIQPYSLDTNQNATVTFTVTASGTAPLTYYWFDPNNNLIPGQTTSTLTLNNLQPSQSGSYNVTVSNVFGTDFTNFFLNVNQGPPVITTDVQPASQTVYAGTSLTYFVIASGSPPFHYQWTQNGVNIPGATNASYTFAALQGTNTYQVAITNIYSGGSPTLSSVAAVIGMPAPTLNPGDYSYKMKITFSGYNRGETLSDFPALVRLSTALPGFAYSQFASPTGGDLRFTDSGGTREIPHEIDEWNPTNESVVWVQVSSLTSSNDFIWAYWGNANATTPPAYATNGSVWVPQTFENLPSYEIVYHLKESTFPFADSTLQHPATNGVAPVPTNGVVGQGGTFNGSFLDAGVVSLGDTFTMSAWANIDPSVQNIQTIWANQTGGFGHDGFAMSVNSFNTADQQLRISTGNGTAGNETATPSGAVSFGTWHMLAEAIDRPNGIVVFYVDGVAQATSSTLVRTFNNDADLDLGQFIGGSFGLRGLMDEARIRSSVSSSNWVWASYMTVANPTWQTYSAIASSVVNIQYQVINNKLILSGTGTPGATFKLLTSSNVAQPMSTWTPILTNTFDVSGNFRITNSIDATKSGQYFRISVLH